MSKEALTFTNPADALKFMKSVAVQCFGSGKNEGANGGEGFVGLINGKPVKFNTHWHERLSRTTQEMKDSCIALRKSILNAARTLSRDPLDCTLRFLDKTCQDFGVNINTEKIETSTSLLSRKATANFMSMFINVIEDDLKKPKGGLGLFEGAKDLAVSSRGVSTYFDIQKEKEMYINSEPWKIDGPVTMRQPHHKVPIEDYLTKMVLPEFEKECEESKKNALDKYKDQMKLDLERRFKITLGEKLLPFTKGQSIDCREFEEIDRKISEYFGKDEKMCLFFKKFANQGSLSMNGHIRRNFDKGDIQRNLAEGGMFPFIVFPKGDAVYRDKEEHDVKVVKLEGGGYRVTASIKGVPGMLTNTQPDNHGQSVKMYNFNEPDHESYYSYEYTFDIRMDEEGKLTFSVPKPPIEGFCFNGEMPSDQ